MAWFLDIIKRNVLIHIKDDHETGNYTEISKATATKKADIRKETPALVDTRKDTRPLLQVTA